MSAVERLEIAARGRPAPQGSKHYGEHGQMREASPYLPAWRAAVRRAAYEAMKAAGIRPGDRPVFRGVVAVDVTFLLDHGARVDGPPDLDKLLRAVLDALTEARVWEDDARVCALTARKVQALGEERAGAAITVWGIDENVS